jgi:crossover junction endodeoxyribonuclease RuvC
MWRDFDHVEDQLRVMSAGSGAGVAGGGLLAGTGSGSRVSYMRTVRVLGVDPGLTRCGVGIVEGVPGRPCSLVDVRVIGTDPDVDPAERLLHLDRELALLIAQHQPHSVAVERVFSQHNVGSVIATAQASGVAMLAGARHGLPVSTYTPSEVKAAVTGSGQADKKQVTLMVTKLLRLDTPPRPADAADALALAICHVWRGGAKEKVAFAVRKALG